MLVLKIKNVLKLKSNSYISHPNRLTVVAHVAASSWTNILYQGGLYLLRPSHKR